MELSEPYLLLDPRMRKFGNAASLFVDLLRLFRFHLLHERDDCRIRHASHDRAHVRLPGAALPPTGTYLAVSPAGPVDMMHLSDALLLSVMPERLPFRTGVGIVLLIVDKMFGTEGLFNSPLRALAGNPGVVPKGPDEVYACCVHGKDIFPMRVAPVSYHLLGDLAEVLFYPCYRGHKFVNVFRALAHADANDDSCGGVG